ncbi:hypothetical protein [Pseudarthrobacter sulfonivorans]|uniref:hypothetical protein n=1 Tax=Pseudarthrobacter sulfonivorans TaxID=121292 RepID=UPI0027827D1F|nr:hypothetical protein [Pseudarthrobacter sulfonivorans]MDP9998315.1 hypothetical protein [Pseudarthrobacter sulfonivorans]
MSISVMASTFCRPILSPSEPKKTPPTAYGAEIHHYGSQKGLTEKPMLIPQVDFGGIACALGAESAIIRSPADLSALTDWIDAGAKGTFVADCRVTSSVRAPWLSEWMQAKQAKQPA